MDRQLNKKMSEETLGRVQTRTDSRAVSRSQSRASRRRPSQDGDGVVRRLTRTVSNALSAGGYTKNESDRYSDLLDESRAEHWPMMAQLRGFQEQAERDTNKARKLGVTWKNLTVKGIGADAAFNENVFSQYNIPQSIRESRQPAPYKTIIEDSHGCVKPGEMLLVSSSLSKVVLRIDTFCIRVSMRLPYLSTF